MQDKNMQDNLLAKFVSDARKRAGLLHGIGLEGKSVIKNWPEDKKDTYTRLLKALKEH